MVVLDPSLLLAIGVLVECSQQQDEPASAVEEDDLPLPAPRPEPGIPMPQAKPEPISPMQQAVLDSGATEVPGSPVPAFQTNQGTVFLASPLDIKRQELMDSVHVYRGRTYFPTNAEIDRLMKEDDKL